jgi:hypothetical protein
MNKAVTGGEMVLSRNEGVELEAKGGWPRTGYRHEHGKRGVMSLRDWSLSVDLTLYGSLLNSELLIGGPISYEISRQSFIYLLTCPCA